MEQAFQKSARHTTNAIPNSQDVQEKENQVNRASDREMHATTQD